jgi:hypothetical protein
MAAKDVQPYKWRKGQSGNPKGRPPKIINRLEKLIGYEFGLELSRQDKMQIIEWCLERTKEEVDAIRGDKNTPAFIVAIMSGIIRDAKTGSLSALSMIFDRAYGKPTQPYKDESDFDLSELTDEELEYLDRIYRNHSEKTRPKKGKSRTGKKKL